MSKIRQHLNTAFRILTSSPNQLFCSADFFLGLVINQEAQQTWTTCVLGCESYLATMKASVIRNTCSSLRVPATCPGSRVTGLVGRCTPIFLGVLRTTSTTPSGGTKPATVLNFGKLSSNYAGFDCDHSLRYRKNNTGYNVSLNHCFYAYSFYRLCFLKKFN